jgi:hypothetical protein
MVPPALYLALAMTEKHENIERMRIMRETGCSEVEAAKKPPILRINRCVRNRYPSQPYELFLSLPHPHN